MSRPRAPIRTHRLEIQLPEPLYARLALLLYSPTERRVPHGEWSRFFEKLLQQALERQKGPQ